MEMTEVRGLSIDAQTRCLHWHSPVDIVALRFKCCGQYFACHACHEAMAGHAALRYSFADENVTVALCGQCRHEMTLKEYLASDDRCPHCAAPFNPGCRHHVHLYFDLNHRSDHPA